MPDVFLLGEMRVSSSSLISDVKRNVSIFLWLDSSSFWVKYKDLIIVAALANISDDNIISRSSQSTSRFHLGENSEWNIRNNSILYGIRVNVRDLPVLVKWILSILFPYNDILSISILWPGYIKN